MSSFKMSVNKIKNNKEFSNFLNSLAKDLTKFYNNKLNSIAAIASYDGTSNIMISKNKGQKS